MYIRTSFSDGLLFWKLAFTCALVINIPRLAPESICSGVLWDVTVLLISTLRPRRNEQHFADDIIKRIFFNENVWISIKISLKFVPKGPNNNISALVQIMAWRRPGDKPLSEPMMVSLPTHKCATRPQWVNYLAWAELLRFNIVNILAADAMAPCVARLSAPMILTM